MWTDAMFLETYEKSYNSLLGIVEAYHEFEELKRGLAIVGGALRIIAAHKAQNFVGVFLLHRHFRCEAGHVFVERPSTMDGEKVCITQPEAPRQRMKLAPYRFVLLSNGELVPVEFDAEAGSLRRYVRLDRAGSLRVELSRYLTAEGAQRVLGVATFDRKHVGAQRILLEQTMKTKSVTRVVSEFPGNLPAIPTLWTLPRTLRSRKVSRSEGRIGKRSLSGYGGTIERSLPMPRIEGAINFSGCSNGCCCSYCVGTDDNGSGQCSHGSGGHIGCA